MRLTRRGWLLVLGVCTAALLLGVVTANYCWTGPGYGYCGP